MIIIFTFVKAWLSYIEEFLTIEKFIYLENWKQLHISRKVDSNI